MPLVDDLLPSGTRQSEGPLADARGSVRQRTRKNDEQNSTFCTTDSMNSEKTGHGLHRLTRISGAGDGRCDYPGTAAHLWNVASLGDDEPKHDSLSGTGPL